MKTFTVLLFAAGLAAVAHAKKMPKTHPKKEEPKPVVEPEVIDEDAAYWERIDNLNAYGKNTWMGVFQGLYGMSSKV